MNELWRDSVGAALSQRGGGTLFKKVGMSLNEPESLSLISFCYFLLYLSPTTFVPVKEGKVQRKWSAGNIFVVLLCLQIRERLKRRLNVFPAFNDETPTRKTSKVNQSGVGAVGTIEVQPYYGVFELK